MAATLVVLSTLAYDSEVLPYLTIGELPTSRTSKTHLPASMFVSPSIRESAFGPFRDPPVVVIPPSATPAYVIKLAFAGVLAASSQSPEVRSLPKSGVAYGY